MDGRELRKYRELSQVSIERMEETSRLTYDDIINIENNVLTDNQSRWDYSRAINDIKMLEAFQGLADHLNQFNKKAERVIEQVDKAVEYAKAPICVTEVSFDDEEPLKLETSNSPRRRRTTR